MRLRAVVAALFVLAFVLIHLPTTWYEGDVSVARDLTAPPSARPLQGIPTPQSAACSHHDRQRLGTVLHDPEKVHFRQVMTYVGAVPPNDIAQALRELLRLSAAGDQKESFRVTLFALDGTLLNLLRWGRVINDNDVDIGFFIEPPRTGQEREGATTSLAPASKRDVMLQYELLYVALGRAGVVDPPGERAIQRLHHRHKIVKRRTCKHRGQFMQCRHANGVIFDFFGPDSLFTSLTNLTLRGNIVPLQSCRAFDFDFPCPREHLKVLQQFTIDVSASRSSLAVGHYDFAGCALLPRRATERTPAHVSAIVESVDLLHRCGYPSLAPQLNSTLCKEAEAPHKLT